MKKVILAGVVLIILAVGILFIRFFGGGDEDAWICVNNAWVKHGNPRAAMPQGGCGDNKIYDKSDLIKVNNLLPGQEIKSPLVVSGEARGFWFFEASFPVKLVDAEGKVLGQTIAQTTGDWMTESFVPFEATLAFATTTSAAGELILQKDNPSGLPEHDDELRIPVKFIQDFMTVKVYFGTEKTGGAPNYDCSEVEAVERQIPKTAATGRAALEELLKGATEAEKQAGYVTTINSGVKIQSLTIENGAAKADFSQELEETVGGSCRVTAIRAQITETLKQFESVKEVIISIDGRTEDILQP